MYFKNSSLDWVDDFLALVPLIPSPVTMFNTSTFSPYFSKKSFRLTKSSISPSFPSLVPKTAYVLISGFSSR